MNIAISLVVAYLLGSLPFAYLIGRQKGVDIRQVGDRNVGSFNVFRHAGLAAGLATFMLDAGKGIMAIVVAKALHVDEVIVLAAGIAAVAGHIWPVFLGFRGGRGEATIVGVLLAMVTWQMVIAFALGIIVLITTRNSIWVGIAVFIPLAIICFICYWFYNEPPLILVFYTMVLPCFSGISHWLTTRHLPPEAKKEAGTFWIAGHKNQ